MEVMRIITRNHSRLDLRLEGADFVKSPECAEQRHAVQCRQQCLFQTGKMTGGAGFISYHILSYRQGRRMTYGFVADR